MMRHVLTAFVSLLLSTMAVVAEERLNVVLFVVDDLGWMDLGCQGSSYYRTPNIDRLAARGIRFTDAYAACVVCTPTRASIMTGKYPARNLMTQWLPAGRWSALVQAALLGVVVAQLLQGQPQAAAPVGSVAQLQRAGCNRTAVCHVTVEPSNE